MEQPRFNLKGIGLHRDQVDLLTLARAGLVSAVALALALALVTPGRAPSAASDTQVDLAPPVAIPSGAAERLAGSLRIRTVSHDVADAPDSKAFRLLHQYLEDSFPRVHANLRRETVSDYSLLYTWAGSNPTLKPILLMAHMDVVPVEPGTESEWKHDPFGGRISDGSIWGRGAIDNKSAVVGIQEAMEMLLAEGFKPERTVYIAYGHDEETGGTRGARGLAELLKGRGVELEMVLDEGGVIGDGILRGLSTPVALIGVVEKGFASVELSVQATGGHSSLPPPQSAVGILSAAVARLEQDPMPARLEGATRELFDRVGPRFPLAQRAVFANLWLTRPLVIRKLESHPTTNAMVRTTAAATIFQAGTKDNVLPSRARAVINFRIAPADSISAVIEHVRRVVDDPRVQIRLSGGFSAEPSAVSSSRSASFVHLERAIRSVVPDAIAAPYQVVVVTDSRYFAGFTENVYRFLPLRLTSADLERIHGTDERLAISEYERAIRFYRQLLVNATG